MEDIDKLLSVQEASDTLKVHPQTIRNWIRTNVIPSYRPNPKGKIFIKYSDIKSLFSSQRTASDELVEQIVQEDLLNKGGDNKVEDSE